MNFKAFSEEELNTFSKEMIITSYLQLVSFFQILSKQNEELIRKNEEQIEEQRKQNAELLKQIENLQENLAILTNYRFGRKTEKTSDIMDGQMVLALQDGTLILNEVEKIADDLPEEEKSDEELLAELKARREARKRKKNVREADLRMAEVEFHEYTISNEELNEMFPEGYREMDVVTTRTVEYTPAKLVVHEEHIHTYKSVKNNVFVTADHPEHLFAHSILTPSLAAKIFYDKYVNAVPINRTSREFGWLGAVIRPQTMSRWMIKLTDKYLKYVTERMRFHMKDKAKLIHCDETPFICEEDRKKDGCTKNSKSYMWVYHTADQYGSPPIFIYDYHDNRRGENVENFLKGYAGYIMSDGYQVYRSLGKKSNGLIKVAGCYAHAKRKFADIIKTDPKNAVGTVAFEANHRIAEIYRIDNIGKDLPYDERKIYRKEKVAPFVEDLFAWAKERVDLVGSIKTREALKYLINQEKCLRVFLEDGMIPLDNSDAERSIRSFCLGKHSWHIAATSSGANVSGILYSIAETAKANGLKPYEYFQYLLKQFQVNENNITDEFVDSLLPWSDTLPDEVKAYL